VQQQGVRVPLPCSSSRGFEFPCRAAAAAGSSRGFELEVTAILMFASQKALLPPHPASSSAWLPWRRATTASRCRLQRQQLTRLSREHRTYRTGSARALHRRLQLRHLQKFQTSVQAPPRAQQPIVPWLYLRDLHLRPEVSPRRSLAIGAPSGRA